MRRGRGGKRAKKRPDEKPAPGMPARAVVADYGAIGAIGDSAIGEIGILSPTARSQLFTGV